MTTTARRFRGVRNDARSVVRIEARIEALLLAGALALLAGCALPPAEPGAKSGGLKPLAEQAGAPPSAPRSSVASVRYDLAVSGYDSLPPDDGLPGDKRPPGDVIERGAASWYGLQFHQRKTANGERFDMGAMTAAHKTLPFNTMLCVRSLANGREVLVRVNDRGPYAAGRIIDLSRSAADAIGMVDVGIKEVALTRTVKGDRCGDQVSSGNPADLAEAPKGEAKAGAKTTRKKRRN